MFFINPFIYGGAGGDFESIATVTVGSGGASSIEFTSIPGTYQHLQIRLLGRSTRTGVTTDFFNMRFNGDTATNYAFHILQGNGTDASAGGYATQSTVELARMGAANATTSIFGAAIIDVVDYTSTSKYKTVRLLGGADANGSGIVSIHSGLWQSTSAITSLDLRAQGGSANWVQHTTAALYGVKAP